MLRQTLKKQATKFRLAIGLCSITMTLMLIGLFIGLLPNQQALVTQARTQLAETVADNGTLLISQKDLHRFESILTHIVTRNENLLAASIVLDDGRKIIDIGERNYDQFDLVSVPIWENDTPWGSVALEFKPLYSPGVIGFIQQPVVQFIVFVSCISFVFFFFYLGRMLKLLDPSQAIPDRVRSALDTMAEGLLVLDAKHNIVLANQAFAQIVAKSPGDLVGMNCKGFQWENIDGSSFDSKQSPWGLAISQSKAVTSQRVRLNLSDNSRHTFMVNCSPVLAHSGKAGGVLVSFDDVTVLEQKEIELLRSKEEAEIANQSKSDFLANMSHEIRTPMNAIMGFTEVLRKGYGRGENSAQYLDTIAKNSRHLLALINDILDLSKVESGQIEVENIPCALHDVIFDVLEVLEISAKNKSIALTYKPLTAMPETLTTDPARVRQIITNLVGNAIKFTQKGGVTITTEWRPESDPNHIQIHVEDTGIGMTETQQSQIFSPFVQADSSITRRFGGTGLGLTISKKFAEALGGGITVASHFGKGSRFTFTMATGKIDNVVSLSPDEILKGRQNEHQIHTQWKLPKARVLVVDDSEENRELIRLVLTHQGLTVDTANNGKEGLAAILSNDYQMVLMDVQMPEMDGYTAVKAVRQKHISIPVFALTAHAMKGIEQKCKQAGFDGYVAKPVSISGLLEQVAHCIGGEPVEGDAQAVPILTDIQTAGINASLPSKEVKNEKAAVVSILQNNPKYSSIISKFVERLLMQLEEAEVLFKKNDLDGLKEVAHKLKGSAGTVGFYDFTDPFHRMEVACAERDSTTIRATLAEVQSLYERIDKTHLELADANRLHSSR